MASPQNRISRRNHSRGIWLPDMAPFASAIFLLVCPLIMSGQMRMPRTATVSDEQLPSSHQEGTCSVREAFGSVIGLDSKSQLSFAMPESPKELQSAVIKRVAALHQVQLTSPQLAALDGLPFLATDVQFLPEMLALTAPRRAKLVQSGKLAPLSDSQLIECITEALALLKREHRPYHIGVKIDAEAKMSQVFLLTELLQTQGINRLYLMTRWEGWTQVDWLLHLNQIKT